MEGVSTEERDDSGPSEGAGPDGQELDLPEEIVVPGRAEIRNLIREAKKRHPAGKGKLGDGKKDGGKGRVTFEEREQRRKKGRAQKKARKMTNRHR